MEAERVLERTAFEKLQNALAMLELPLEVSIDMIFQVRRHDLLAIVVPIRIDADQQVGLFPVDGIAVDVSLARSAACRTRNT